ncbi:MAG: TVP38/TMEM64 family protein [Chloroflexi bacterium]|nr:TVP38/TMEM64 family protein [Chloroflexota bacterium]
MKTHPSIHIGIALFILLAVLFLALFLPNQWALFQDQEHLRDWVSQWGVWKPVAVVFLQMAQVLLAPVPGQVVGLVSGYFFGVVWGTVYSIAGTTLGSAIAFLLARIFGRPLVERLTPAPTLKRLDDGAQRRGLFFFLLVFLIPFLPDDLTCFVAGLSPIPIPALVLVAMAGRLPGIFVSCWVGANAMNFTTTQWALLIAASALLAALFLLYGDQLQAWAWKLTGSK